MLRRPWDSTTALRYAIASTMTKGGDDHGKSHADPSSSIIPDFFGGNDVIEVPNSRIARGAFGEVALAIHSAKRRVVAVKTVFQSISNVSAAQKLTAEVAREVSALQRLCGHENIVTLLAMYPSVAGSSITLAFEYCPVDLHLTLEWRRKGFLPLLPMKVIRTIARDLFAGLQHMHSRQILHLDIKPGNLLVAPATGHVQICDFGLSQSTSPSQTQIDDDNMPRGLCTLQYRPPELLLGCLASDASVDMYSAAMVICELLLGRPLFPGRSVLDQLTLIFGALGTPTPESWPNVERTPDYSKLVLSQVPPSSMAKVLPRAAESEHLVYFLDQLMVLDPGKRLSSEQALRHSWLADDASLAGRRDMLRELVPDELEEPLMLSIDGDGLKVAKRQVEALALKRRQLLSRLVPALQD